VLDAAKQQCSPRSRVAHAYDSARELQQKRSGRCKKTMGYYRHIRETPPMAMVDEQGNSTWNPEANCIPLLAPDGRRFYALFSDAEAGCADGAGVGADATAEATAESLEAKVVPASAQDKKMVEKEENGVAAEGGVAAGLGKTDSCADKRRDVEVETCKKREEVTEKEVDDAKDVLAPESKDAPGATTTADEDKAEDVGSDKTATPPDPTLYIPQAIGILGSPDIAGVGIICRSLIASYVEQLLL